MRDIKSFVNHNFTYVSQTNNLNDDLLVFDDSNFVVANALLLFQKGEKYLRQKALYNQTAKCKANQN